MQVLDNVHDITFIQSHGKHCDHSLESTMRSARQEAADGKGKAKSSRRNAKV